MSLDELLPELERLEKDGAVVLLKWDGERTHKKKSVVILNPGTDYQFRTDTDDLAAAIRKGIADYDDAHRKFI